MISSTIAANTCVSYSIVSDDSPVIFPKHAGSDIVLTFCFSEMYHHETYNACFHYKNSINSVMSGLKEVKGDDLILVRSLIRKVWILMFQNVKYKKRQQNQCRKNQQRMVR